MSKVSRSNSVASGKGDAAKLTDLKFENIVANGVHFQPGIIRSMGVY